MNRQAGRQARQEEVEEERTFWLLNEMATDQLIIIHRCGRSGGKSFILLQLIKAKKWQETKLFQHAHTCAAIYSTLCSVNKLAFIVFMAIHNWLLQKFTHNC